MFVSQRPWIGCRGPYSPVLPLILLPLSFLLAQGAISIPEHLQTPPSLTVVPAAVTAFSREDIILTCEASGNPTPHIRWVKDGAQFGREQKGSGKVNASEYGKEAPLESFAGFYQCFASNDLGTAMTQTVKVIVEPHPFIPKENELTKTAFVGQSIILTCNPPKRSTPPRIYWMGTGMVHIPQNERVMIGLDGNLYFSNLVMDDSREDYNCYAQYTSARTIIHPTAVKLTVQSSNDVSQEKGPHFLQPQDSHNVVPALRGQTVTLECIPKGLPTPKVEWQKTDGVLKTTSASLNNSARWLHFKSITEDDDGEYKCRAHNIHGNATRSFTITVKAAPYWTKQSPDLKYAPGETVRLDCLAKGNPDPTITWRINGEPLTGGTAVDEDSRRTVTSSALILRDVVLSDTAVYQCEATNVHGSILQNINLFVVELPPQILSSDGMVYKVFEDEDINMDCESFGAPRPHISWERDDMVPLLSDPRVSLFTNGTIEIVNVTHEDQGVYTCSVDNTNISITANLEVFDKTEILKGPQDIYVHRGEAVFLDCHFYKDPRLHGSKVHWKKDNLNLRMLDKYTFFKNNTLKVTKVQSDDTGNYTCEVETEPLGHVKATGSIIVEAPPGPPGSVSLSGVEDHSVNLSWIPGPSHNSPITVFIVEGHEQPHSEGRNSAWQTWTTVPGNFSHVVLRLKPFCNYRFRVTAVNKIGQSNPSKPSNEHRSPPAAPGLNPTNVRTNSTDPGTLLITWDEMEKHLHNGQDFKYQVYWREANNKNTNWNTASVKSPPFIVNNTGTFTPFEIKVQAVNAVGSGPAPVTMTGHSGEDKPEEAPTGVSTTVMNSTVRVTWNQVRNVRGHLLGYRIYIRRLGPSSRRDRRSLGKHHHMGERDKHEHHKRTNRDSWMVEVRGPKTSAEVTGLRLFSQYELRLTAFNSKGESPPSTPVHLNTPEGAPGPPASLRFESPTETSLILHWTPPHEINGKLLGYVVQYQQDGESHGNLVKFEMISDQVNHFELNDLDPSSYYIFKVIALTAAGQGPYIEGRVATLLEGVPPSNITVVSSNTSFNLSWVPGDRHRNHGFHIHYLRWKSGKELEKGLGSAAGVRWERSELINSTQGFYSLTGLQPGTKYSLMILHDNNSHWQQDFRTMGPEPSEMPGRFATQGWLIGLISAILLLILILLILCLIKRSRGGKYAVKDKEKKEIDFDLQNKDETFGEYRSLESDGDEKRSDSQRSLCDHSKLGSEDSLAEYGDSVDIQFNEDGSFIGQYSGRAAAPHGNESSGPASPVNPVPPPPIAPSMSSVLNRPS
ncbi:neural cell adhesion molecule L1.1-like isoform X4 [Girardinichthys multiradiatus]|uniref:neural cell adhesion molecule L1.1-like isoform X4 n=1 Tax=Girardinichthys multiradiatus TaxID=208333 RepID=UPI001FADE95A|nr:neural cell adhesion molecule L1.1-like isoform X4 [Girardinichthys multiradiatus]